MCLCTTEQQFGFTRRHSTDMWCLRKHYLITQVDGLMEVLLFAPFYTVFQKKTSTHIIGYKLRNSCPILIIFDIKIPHII